MPSPLLQAINEHVSRCQESILLWAGKLPRDEGTIVASGATPPWDAFDAPGYAALYGAYQEALLATYRGLLESLGRMLSDQGRSDLRQTMAAVLSDLNNCRRYMLDQFASRVLRLDGMDIEEAHDKLTAWANEYRMRLDTVTQTGLMTFSTKLTMTQGEESGAEYYTLSGPDDGLTRPWCSHFVGTKFTLDDFQAHAGDWGRNADWPVEMRGGYNCRHRLSIVPLTQLDQYEEGPRP